MLTYSEIKETDNILTITKGFKLVSKKAAQVPKKISVNETSKEKSKKVSDKEVSKKETSQKKSEVRDVTVNTKSPMKKASKEFKYEGGMRLIEVTHEIRLKSKKTADKSETSEETSVEMEENVKK